MPSPSLASLPNLTSSPQPAPNLFSSCIESIQLAEQDQAAIEEAVAALHSVSQTEAWRSRALREMSPSQLVGKLPGLWLGVDFHLTAEGPKLIEINTNPGGLFLSAQGSAEGSTQAEDATTLRLLSVFAQEARRPFRRMAIVDDAPQQQFLYSEFLLIAKLLGARGVEVDIVDASHPPQALRDYDLVYNRCTDFYLTSDEHRLLRQLERLSPNPQAYALHADKHRLLDLEQHHEAALQRVRAESRAVQALDPERLWKERAQWFFKPMCGFGSKAAYRGDKVTKKVWDHILSTDYLAQRLAPPSEVETKLGRFKIDVRAVAYQGHVLHWMARAYQGQTTNFRTNGGGFVRVRTHLQNKNSDQDVSLEWNSGIESKGAQT